MKFELGYRGWGCTDATGVNPRVSIFLSSFLLTFSNAFFLPAIYIAAKRRLYTEGLVYLATMLFSSLYHACDQQFTTYCVAKYEVSFFIPSFCSDSIKSSQNLFSCFFTFFVKITWKLNFFSPTGAAVLRLFFEHSCILGDPRCHGTITDTLGTGLPNVRSPHNRIRCGIGSNWITEYLGASSHWNNNTSQSYFLISVLL